MNQFDKRSIPESINLVELHQLLKNLNASDPYYSPAYEIENKAYMQFFEWLENYVNDFYLSIID